MKNSGDRYNYLDPFNEYTLENGVLRNLAKIEDEKVLLAFESLKVSRRLEELYANPIKILDSSALLHRDVSCSVWKSSNCHLTS